MAITPEEEQAIRRAVEETGWGWCSGFTPVENAVRVMRCIHATYKMRDHSLRMLTSDDAYPWRIIDHLRGHIRKLGAALVEAKGRRDEWHRLKQKAEAERDSARCANEALRGEVARLRAELEEVIRLREENAALHRMCEIMQALAGQPVQQGRTWYSTGDTNDAPSQDTSEAGA